MPSLVVFYLVIQFSNGMSDFVLWLGEIKDKSETFEWTTLLQFSMLFLHLFVVKSFEICLGYVVRCHCK